MMSDEQLLAVAIEVHKKHGVTGKLRVHLDRMPSSRYIKLMQVRPKRGPWGDIVALTTTGAMVEFHAHKLITWLSADINRIPGLKGMKRTSRMGRDRQQIHPVVSAAVMTQIAEIAFNENRAQSAVIEDALSNYVELCKRGKK